MTGTGRDNGAVLSREHTVLASNHMSGALMTGTGSVNVTAPNTEGVY